MLDPDIASDYEKVIALSNEMDAHKKTLEGLYHDWESLHEELEKSNCEE